jgi:hypothetical protein
LSEITVLAESGIFEMFLGVVPSGLFRRECFPKFEFLAGADVRPKKEPAPKVCRAERIFRCNFQVLRSSASFFFISAFVRLAPGRGFKMSGPFRFGCNAQNGRPHFAIALS